VQVASEVCASPPPGAIADEKQLDPPPGELISDKLAYPTVFSKAFSLTCRGWWMKTSTLVITPDQGIIGFTVSKWTGMAANDNISTISQIVQGNFQIAQVKWRSLSAETDFSKA
jgi:hypothetical protein